MKDRPANLDPQVQVGRLIHGIVDNLETLDAAQLSALIHELRAHHSELTLQNEMLRRERARLEALRNRYVELYEDAPIGYLSLSPNGLIRNVNRTVCHLLGYGRRFLLNQPFNRFVLGRDRIDWVSLCRRLTLGGGSVSLELVLHCRCGQQLTVISACSVLVAKGRLREIRLTLNERNAPHCPAIQEQLAGAVIDAANEAVLVTDLDHRILFVNPAFTCLTGFAPDQALGRDVVESLAPDAEIRSLLAELWRTLIRAKRWHGDVMLCRADGASFPASVSLTLIRNGSGQECRIAATLVDITERKQAEEQFRYQANYDSVTRLPNRSLFLERLSQALKQARRKQCLAALLFLDLDCFKQINDLLGHETGDRLLHDVGQRLLHCVRGNDSVARVGGDEFAIVLPEVPGPRMAASVARKILAALVQPFEVMGNEVSIGASIGIALYPMDADNIDTLRQHADLAMYRAKHAGRCNYQFFAGSMGEAVQRVMRIGQDLRHALRRGELVLYYQPIFELGSGNLVGAEALLRWQHPSQGLLPPEPFLAVAEDTGLMQEIGEWALYEAFREAASWGIANKDLPYVSINLSNRQLTARGGIGTLPQVLAASGLEAERVVLEITEGVMMNEISSGVGQLRSLKNLGLRLALDDFGTGYSSLTYLKRFPIDLVKIDQSSIADIEVDAAGKRLVEGILSLTHGLGLKVIAEGVEAAEQEAFLRRLSCDYVQGFYYGRPSTAACFRDLLREDVSPRWLNHG